MKELVFLPGLSFTQDKRLISLSEEYFRETFSCSRNLTGLLLRYIVQEKKVYGFVHKLCSTNRPLQVSIIQQVSS